MIITMSTRIGIDNPVTLQQILNQMKAYQAELRQIKQEKAAIAEAHVNQIIDIR